MNTELMIKNNEIVPISALKERWEMLNQFLREILVEGDDYYIVDNRSKKPSLAKSGAEKLSQMYKLSPRFTHEYKYNDKQLLVISTCQLYHRETNILWGEGSGIANTTESKYAKTPPENMYNTILKMADKRAFVAATLFATGASHLFTQDLEDIQDTPKKQSNIQVGMSTNGNGNGKGSKFDDCPNCRERGVMPSKFGKGFYCVKCNTQYTENMEMKKRTAKTADVHPWDDPSYGEEIREN